MSNEMIIKENGGYLAAAINLGDLFSEEMDGLTPTFDRIKIPAGGGISYEVPGDDPSNPDSVKEFKAVILYHHPIHSYYKEKFTGGNNPPDCGSMQEQRVEFCRGEVKGHLAKPRSIIKKTDHKAIAAALQCGYDCYDDIATDPNHRYLSWEYCHAAFKQHRQQHDEATVDFLCLHLAWYLASWGMLRNSFLMQKDYKIHAAVVTLVNQPEWEMLWDISADKLAQEWYANRIMQLCEAITEAYVPSGAGIPAETLLTKILLGTIGCVPAYDRYFKKALSLTGAAQQSCNARSLMALGKLYIDHRDEFEALRKHCSERVEYPAAKVIDMCFFEYGLRNDGGGEE